MENIQLIKLIRNCLAGDLVFLNFNITIFIQTAINPEADFFSGGREGRGKRGGVRRREHEPALLLVPRQKIMHKQKIQKHNLNKIYLTKPRLKEITWFMIIAETKNTFSYF